MYILLDTPISSVMRIKQGGIYAVLFNGDTLLKITEDLKDVFNYVGSSYQSLPH